MVNRNLKISVKPSILEWARESSGEDIERVAKKLRVEVQEIKKWESQESLITISKLRNLAKIYKRPLAVFFLSKKPSEKLPNDYRVLPENQGRPLLRVTKLAIRKIQHLQITATELSELLNQEAKYKVIKIGADVDPEVLAEQIRLRMNITSKQQIELKNDTLALALWKKVIEEMGILVFQMSVPVNEIRGFSLIENNQPVIAINIKDSVRARIFSLFHEYCHILLNDVGFCDLEEEYYSSGHIKKIEEYCNHFAGAFLVPKNTLLSHPLIKKIENNEVDLEEVLKKVSNNFKVSQEVILRRLLMFKRISKQYYLDKRVQLKKDFIKIESYKGKKRWLVPYKKCIQELGTNFITMVFEARTQSLITVRDMVDYLGVKRKHISKVEEFLFSS